ncbi:MULTISPECIES: DUF6230 family protein [Nocardiopsis]|uniref:Cholesterol esterase n=1 Tax=Nocardiopsis dassonvillei (strain ATCC 23218 / DSM 43111 / CIP 107115 / JCM 7437 / KCTC 9190 / NBRC 14626 / NCTC 10488 / NRRL B-5397 / IMRU 509) TaxID=446468 RepID=D7B6V2_NOCDD|nr:MULTISPECIES: DUF6230 family protein [Nocardiopsis]ADH65506.1 cholesterol esterase [Nocardiopsis dassonvillei subsp. dassonvillei DSM 43111]APC33238.1 cholesterol esterase [Nocardiopsis dassonvillei]NKY82127.1 cholesterol esterase [Nocardiopsis dassonvillei]VEI90824.1 Uncharacterised protein [Nocardiopsis dassonvillei]
MDTTSPDTPESHTSWKRFALFSIPAGAAVGGILVAMAQGALAASFTVSGQDFKISAEELNGEGFVQYGWLDQTVREEAVPVAVAGIREAEIQGLCQSVLTEFPIVGQISLRLTAGDRGTPVVAENLVIDMSQMDGNASFEDIEIGRDAGTLDQGPQGSRGFDDLFGMQSDTIVIEDLEQTARAASAGTFRLSGLSLGISMGDDECF